MKEESKIKKIGKGVLSIGSESINEIKNQGIKTIKDIKDFALNAYNNIKDNLDFKKAFNDATVEFEIVGANNIFSQPIKIRAFIISNNELLFKYDDKEIKRILSGTLLKNISKVESMIKIVNIDNTKQINHKILVNDEEYIIPCFRAKYKHEK